MAKHEINHHKAEHVEHHHHARGGETEPTKMEMDRPYDPEKSGGHVRRPRRARGGGAREYEGRPHESHGAVNEYNAQDAPEMKETEEGEDGFSHGGRKKRRHGGAAEGHHEEHRADKMPRGRRKHGGHAAHHSGEGDIHLHKRHGGEAEHGEHHRRAAGGQVYSEASKIRMPKEGKDSRGHEGVHVPEEPGPG